MIQLIVGEKKICFNLKDKDREQGLYYAWYSMSDMSTHQTKKLKIKTDTGEELIFQIKEIQDCQYIDKVHVPEEPKTEDKTQIVSELYDQFFPVNDPVNQEIKRIFMRTFETFSKDQLIRLFTFTKEITPLGPVPVNRFDLVLLLRDVAHSPTNDLSGYVKRYQELIANKGQK
jgi:hypothetical protein